MQASEGLFLFCWAPARHSFLIQRPGRDLWLKAHLSFLKFTANQPRTFDNQLKWPPKLLGSSVCNQLLGSFDWGHVILRHEEALSLSDAAGCVWNTPRFKLWVSRRCEVLGGVT